MALESFGTETAKNVDRAVTLCHDMLKSMGYDKTKEHFKAGDPPLWEVWPDTDTSGDYVIVRLGVG